MNMWLQLNILNSRGKEKTRKCPTEDQYCPCEIYIGLRILSVRLRELQGIRKLSVSASVEKTQNVPLRVN